MEGFWQDGKKGYMRNWKELRGRELSRKFNRWRGVINEADRITDISKRNLLKENISIKGSKLFYTILKEKWPYKEVSQLFYETGSNIEPILKVIISLL